MVRGADWFDEELRSLGPEAEHAREAARLFERGSGRFHEALLAFNKKEAIPKDLPKAVKMAFAAR